MKQAQYSFVAEYPCDDFCRVELEMDDERPRLTLGLMRRAADHQHQARHEPPPEPTPILNETAATFQAPAR